MVRKKLFTIVFLISAAVMVCMNGCGPTNGDGAQLSKKFKPNAVVTYRLVSTSTQTVEWEGQTPEKEEFQPTENVTKVDITFTEEIQSVDEEGNGLVKVTVNALKYSEVIKNKKTVEFDSATNADPENALAKMLGQSYIIKLAPWREVVGVVETRDIQRATRSPSSYGRAATALLSVKAIEDRHGFVDLPREKHAFQAGSTWQSHKTFDFGLLGVQSFDRVYQVNSLDKTDSEMVASVDMSSSPAGKSVEEFKQETEMQAFQKAFNSSGTYNGKLLFNVTEGLVQSYKENLEAEWTILDPSAKENDAEGPVALRMAASRSMSIDRVE